MTSHKGDEVTEIKEESELIKFAPTALADEIGFWVYEIIILSQIARPGSLKLREGKVFVDDSWTLSLPKILHNREEIEFQKERDYPEIQYLDFVPFYDWIVKNNLLFPMAPENSYQKAINNLSYVSSVEDEIGRFVYQMRILEEIYTDSIHQIAVQLNKKIQLFLGELETFKKQIKNMYNVRSRFMHGESLIVPFHKTDYAEHDYDKSYDKEVNEAVSFSYLLIIATLQKMYLNNYLEINYELKITGHNRVDGSASS